MSWIFYVLFPVLLHLLIGEGTAVIAGNSLDSAACTALSAFLVLPAAIWMYRRDAALHQVKNGNSHGSSLREGNIPHEVWDATRRGNIPHEEWDATRRGNIPHEEWDATWKGRSYGNAHEKSLRILHRKSVRQSVWILASFLGGGLMNLLYSSLLNAVRISSYFSNQTQEELLTSSFVMQLLGPGLLVPIAEELIFRGLTYTRMKTRLNVRNAVFFSALLFALYHGNPIQMIYAFPMAVLLALLYERGGNILYPILFHMGANLAAILSAL